MSLAKPRQRCRTPTERKSFFQCPIALALASGEVVCREIGGHAPQDYAGEGLGLAYWGHHKSQGTADVPKLEQR